MGSSCSMDHGAEDDWCLALPQSKRKKKKKDRNRHLMESLSAEAKTSELLSRVAGRISSNGSTSTACAFTQQGKKGTNQDAMVVWENYASRKDTLLCGVFDGHGPCGHLVARKVRDALPSKLMAIWKARMRGDDEDVGEGYGYEESEYWRVAMDQTSINNHPSSLSINDSSSSTQSHDVNPNMKHPNNNNLTFAMWKESILKCFNLMDRDLRTHPTIDCYCSGTTAVILLKQGEELIIGNVGDSRAVLGVAPQEDDQTLEAIQLTVDLKPSLPGEAERIRRCKGRVFSLEDEPEVTRVWLPYDDAPGLAMARAFGDFCLKDYGLISVPEITYRRLTPKDQFVILATDGIWDVLSNRQAVEVVSSASTKAKAARLLVETAVRAWRLKYPTSKVDDCAVVCLFFNNLNITPQRSTFKFMDSSRPKYYTPQQQEEEEEEEEEQEEEEEEEEAAACNMHAQRQQNEESRSWWRSSTTNPLRTPQCFTSQEDSIAAAATFNGLSYPAPSSSSSVIEIEESPSSTDHGDGGGVLLMMNNINEHIMPPPRRSLAECISNHDDDDDDEWSALEGVVRVNSILNLPRDSPTTTRRRRS